MKENTEETQTPLNSREMIIDLLGRLHPESDLSDEEVLFGHILSDYSQYAEVLEQRDHELAIAHAEGELYGRNAKIEEMMAEEPATDGVPDLGGANATYSTHTASIFEIAKGSY